MTIDYYKGIFNPIKARLDAGKPEPSDIREMTKLLDILKHDTEVDLAFKTALTTLLTDGIKKIKKEFPHIALTGMFMGM